MKRPQFTLRALLVVMLVVAAFGAGMRFEHEWQRRRDRDYDQVRRPRSARYNIEYFNPTEPESK